MAPYTPVMAHADHKDVVEKRYWSWVIKREKVVNCNASVAGLLTLLRPLRNVRFGVHLTANIALFCPTLSYLYFFSIFPCVMRGKLEYLKRGI